MMILIVILLFIIAFFINPEAMMSLLVFLFCAFMGLVVLGGIIAIIATIVN